MPEIDDQKIRAPQEEQMEELDLTPPIGPRDLGLPGLRPHPTQADHPERPIAAAGAIDTIPRFRAAVWACWLSFSWKWDEPMENFIPEWEFFRPADTPMRQLSLDERRGLRFTVTEIEDTIALPGITYEAKYRFALWQHRGKLKSMSGLDVARELSAIYFNRDNDLWPGFDFIRVLDDLDFVPTRLPSGHRLKDRLAA